MITAAMASIGASTTAARYRATYIAADAMVDPLPEDVANRLGVSSLIPIAWQMPNAAAMTAASTISVAGEISWNFRFGDGLRGSLMGGPP